jgi:hypothetical protein
MLRNVLVLLLGFPGVGKLTIARELGQRIPARVIDNHWINNPVLALLNNDGHGTLPEAVWDQTAKVRQAVLDTIATLCDPAASFIFTNAGIHGDARSVASYHQVKDAADRRRARFLPVRLVCDEDELVRRVVSPQRRDRLKSIDVEAARLRCRTAAVLDPEHPDGLTLDVTRASAAESAQSIYARLVDLAACGKPAEGAATS